MDKTLWFYDLDFFVYVYVLLLNTTIDEDVHKPKPMRLFTTQSFEDTLFFDDLFGLTLGSHVWFHFFLCVIGSQQFVKVITHVQAVFPIVNTLWILHKERLLFTDSEHGSRLKFDIRFFVEQI